MYYICSILKHTLNTNNNVYYYFPIDPWVKFLNFQTQNSYFSGQYRYRRCGIILKPIILRCNKLKKMGCSPWPKRNRTLPKDLVFGSKLSRPWAKVDTLINSKINVSPCMYKVLRLGIVHVQCIRIIFLLCLRIILYLKNS